MEYLPQEGRKMALESTAAAQASGDLLVSTGDVVAAQMSLNSLMGTAVKFSGGILQLNLHPYPKEQVYPNKQWVNLLLKQC